MRILLIAPIHREKEYLKIGGNPFPAYQGQKAWVHAFEKLGHKVNTFIYTESVLVPNLLRIYIADFFMNKFPVWYARHKRFKSKYYYLSFENYLMNKKINNLTSILKPELIIISGGISANF